MRGCPRCGTTYPPGVLYCANDGTATVEAPAAPVADTDALIGRTVGNFKLTRKLGAGAMGSVYEGIHPLVGIRVAVKVLGGKLAIEPELVERFFAEAQALNQVAHENIVKVIDLGTHPEGFYYCVMELLEGETLNSLSRYGRIQLMRGIFLTAQIADGLAAAHEKGIVHRDLKPSNIMIVRHPTTGVELVKIVDFGIAKLQSKATSASATVAGMIIGTPQYMSPEQAAGRAVEVDGRSDLYSLGLVAYELFTGVLPFKDRPIGELIVAQITETPPSARTLVQIPERLDALIDRLLKKRKEDRPRDATEVSRELRQILQSVRDAGLAPKPAATVAPALAPPSIPPPMPPVVAPSQPPPIQAAPVEVEEPPAIIEPEPEPPPQPPIREVSRIDIRSRAPSIAPAKKTSARRKPPRQMARGAFFIAFLVATGLLVMEILHVVNFESLVGSAVTAMGVEVAEVRYGNRAKLASDGTAAAFAAAPSLQKCRQLLKTFQGLAVNQKADLEEELAIKLGAYNKFEDCIKGSSDASTHSQDWVGAFLSGFAAYRMASDLDHLPSQSQIAARDIEDKSGVRPYDARLYAQQAANRFNDARPDATALHQGIIDGYLSDLDHISQRARQDDVEARP